MTITLTGIEKRFGRYPALNGIDLAVRDGEFLALLGPSGSGKTTLLRIIAGLEFADAGTVAFGGADMSRVPVSGRNVGFVFQQYALFRHMTVAKNIAFGLKVRRRRDRPPAAAIAARVEELLDLVQLPGLGGRYPAQLSGGQRQRVALARALAIEPRILLLDEPFGALDAKVRKDLRRWLRQLHEEIGLTSIFVTHDQEEALELADRVVVMNKGAIEQVAEPRTLYEQPATAFVHDFVGESNRLNVEIAGGRATWRGLALDLDATGVADGPAALFLRPHELAVAADGIPGEVGLVRPVGGLSRLEVAIEGRDAPLEVDVASRPPATGDAIRLRPSGGRLYPEA